MNACLHQHHRSRRRGQSLVIIALSATALLGIIALGMDAGRLYFQRRDVQNAADAGALAGAEELISSGAIAGQTTGMRTQANCQASLYALNNLALTPSNPTCDSSYQPNGSGFIRESSNDGTATVTVWTPSRGVSNEIHVQVSYRVPLTFAAILGFTSSAVVADAYAHNGFYNKTYTVFGFDAGGSGNSVNYDQNGNAQIDDGFNGTGDICQPSSVQGKMVSNAKWHAPNPNGGWLDLNGQFFYAQASDTHALTLYWYSPVTTSQGVEAPPGYSPPLKPADALPPTLSGGVYTYSPGTYHANINATSNGARYKFLNGIYYFDNANFNISGNVIVTNTSDGLPHYSAFGGVTDLAANPADGTNGVEFVFDGSSTFSATSSGNSSPFVFFTAPTFVPSGTDSIVFFIKATDTVSGPNGTPWVEQIDGNKPTPNGYPFQIWGTLYNADLNGSHGTGAVIQAVSTSRYAITGEVASPQVDLDGGGINGTTGNYTASNPGSSPCNPNGYHQNTAGYLVQFNSHYVPHWRGLSYLVK